MSKQPPKRPRGRPKGTGTGRTGRAINLYLPHEAIARLERLGDGSASAGVQRLLDATPGN